MPSREPGPPTSAAVPQWDGWKSWASDRGWVFEQSKLAASARGDEQGWSVHLSGEEIEAPSTEVRLRYQRIGVLPLITLRRRGGSVRVQSGWWFSRRRRPVSLPKAVSSAFMASPADLLVVESYSGDTRAFRADGLRVSARRVLRDPAELDEMVRLAVLTAKHLCEIGAVVARPAPS